MNWQQTATSDAAAIRALWRRNPDANIGVRCGENITVLDVDGDLGRSTLRDLELEKGELPETPIALTGSGGCHYYFAFEPSLGNAVRFAPGLDVRTEGGLVVGVGSQNRNGPYRWEAIAELSDTLKPAKMPAWLAELIAGAQPQTGPNGHFVLPSAPIAAGEGRNKTLYSLGRSLKARNLPPSAIRAALTETNKVQCQPPLDGRELDALIFQVTHEKDRSGFNPPATLQNGQEVSAWPDPEEPELKQTPVSPMRPEMLPEPLRPWLCDIADRFQCPLEYIVIPAVVSAGAVLGGKLTVRPKRDDDWREYPNLWGVIVGRPGVLKSPALNEALKPIAGLERAARDAFEQGKRIREIDLKYAAAQREGFEAELKKLAREGKPIGPIRDKLLALNEKPAVERRYLYHDSTVEKV